MTTANPLNDLLTPQIRKYLYAAYVLAGIVVGALAVAGVDVGKAPDVLAYLAIPFGALAASNITSVPEDNYDIPDDGLSYEEAGGQPFGVSGNGGYADASEVPGLHPDPDGGLSER